MRGELKILKIRHLASADGEVVPVSTIEIRGQRAPTTTSVYNAAWEEAQHVTIAHHSEKVAPDMTSD